jgi:hypothetical protein
MPQPNIHEHDVWLILIHPLKSVCDCTGLGHDLPAGLAR